MQRKEELNKIISDAQAELAVIRKHDMLLNELEAWLPIAKNAGVSEEEVLSLVDAIYHPEGDSDG